MMNDSDPNPGELLARRLSGFVKLDPAEQAAIVAIAGPARSSTARRDLVHEGAIPGPTLLITSGWACAYKTLEDGRRQILSFLLPGDMCDVHTGLLDHMDHSVGALRSVSYSEISNKALRQLASDHPRVGEALYRQMLVSLSVQREWTTNIGQRNALERVGHLFCELYTRLNAVDLVAGNSFVFPLTQIDIAGATGLTPVHVNRTIRQLKTLGLVKLSERLLLIPNLVALMRASLFSPDYLHLHDKKEHAKQTVPRVGASL